MTDKESTRTAWNRVLSTNNGAPRWGKGAEHLRSLRLYRDSATIFATPGKSLHQIRINCLADGKNLIMPAPSLRKGFFFLPARSVAFKDLSSAVTYKGLEKHGQPLHSSSLPLPAVKLLLTDSLVVDAAGNRLGDGNGFFDLCCALLQELGILQPDWSAGTVVQEGQISRDRLPQDPWDIKMSYAVTPAGVRTFGPVLRKPGIYWDVLTTERIRRIDPLWRLYNAKDTITRQK